MAKIKKLNVSNYKALNNDDNNKSNISYDKNLKK